MAPLPPFRVVHVEPLNSNTLRVVLSQEPRHFSPLASDDALLRTNWSVAVTAGNAQAPVVERAENAQAQPNTVGLIDDAPIVGAIPAAWSIDLRVDRRLIAPGVTYQTVAGAALRSIAGNLMTAAPYDRDTHPGRIGRRLPRKVRPAATNFGVDLKYDSFTGAFVLNSRQDVDVHAGLEALKKRILRRLMTRPGGFFHLPTYGAGLQVKGIFNQQEVGAIQRKIRAQVLAESEVAAAEVAVARVTGGVLVVSIKARTVLGPELAVGLEVPPDGAVLVD